MYSPLIALKQVGQAITRIPQTGKAYCLYAGILLSVMVMAVQDKGIDMVMRVVLVVI